MNDARVFVAPITRSPHAFAVKPDDEAARQRIRAFWANASLGDRPALFVTVGNDAFTPGPEPRVPAPRQRDFSIDWHRWHAEAQLSSVHYLCEAFPKVVPFFGSHLILTALIAGAEYEYHSNSAWLRPDERLYERPLPRFDAAHPVVQHMDTVMRAMAEVVGDRGFVSPPPVMDAITTLSGLRGVEALCIDLIERPDDVRAWCTALTDLFLATHDHYHRLTCELGYGEGQSWLCAMAEGRFEAVECDFAVMLSPAQFEAFVLDDLQRQAAYLDFSLYHLDGVAQLRFLDALAKLDGLHGIQWNPEPPENPPTRWIDAFKEMRRRGWVLHIGCASVDEAATIAGELGPDGLLLLLPRFNSHAEADAAVRRVTAACGTAG